METISRVGNDPAAFVDQLAHLNDPLEGVAAFRLWPFQRELLATFDNEQRVIVLKARQLGVSWLVAGYALWSALFKAGANVLMISKRLDEAVSLLDKCEFIYDKLPDYLRASVGKQNETTLQFAKLGSKITALPSTPDAGRSEAASLVIVDEAAFHPHAVENYAAYQPTVAAGGKLIVVSTANGRGNFFHQMWTGAPQNGFTPVFLPWSLRPGRDDAWWEKQKNEYAASPHLLAQENPQHAAEAFVASGNCVFEIAAIQEYIDGCRKPIETSLNGALKLWKRPVVGRRYVAGADVAEGKDAGNDRLDYSGMAVYDWQTCEHVADLHGQWPLDVFAAMAAELGKTYNNAYLGVERNNHGHAVLLKLRELRYPALYYHEVHTHDIKSKQPKVNYEAGWPTTAQTKPVLVDALAAAIRSQSIMSYDEAFWDECLSYVNIGNGQTGAQAGAHDDRVVKHMIALQMRLYLPTSNDITVAQVRMVR